jgi:transcriptional regulator with XRE-family HTH domain
MGRYKSKLDEFLATHELSTSAIARESGVSRKHATEVKKGRSNTTDRTKKRIATACAKVLGRPVSVSELFEDYTAVPRRKAS